VIVSLAPPAALAEVQHAPPAPTILSVPLGEYAALIPPKPDKAGRAHGEGKALKVSTNHDIIAPDALSIEVTLWSFSLASSPPQTHFTSPLSKNPISTAKIPFCVS
jgi:hypothetical protein